MIFLALFSLILIGLITSYEDIQIGRIRNIYIILGLLLGLLILGQEFSVLKLIDFIFALFIGFLLWFIQIWSAGDGKLFTVFALLVPIGSYVHSHLPYFQSLTLIINTCVPLFIILGLNVLFKTSWEYKKKSFLHAFSLRRVWCLAIILFSFIWIVQQIFQFIPVQGSYFLTVVFVFIVMFAIEKTIRIPFFIFTIGASIARIILDEQIWTTAGWLHFLSILIGFLFIRYFMLELSFHHYTKDVPIHALHPGMIPGEIIYEEKRSIKRKNIIHFSLFSYLRETVRGTRVDPRSATLTTETIAKIKQIHKQHPEISTFKIQESLPFAPFLLGGVILTIIVQGNVFIWFASIL